MDEKLKNYEHRRKIFNRRKLYSSLSIKDEFCFQVFKTFIFNSFQEKSMFQETLSVISSDSCKDSNLQQI